MPFKVPSQRVGRRLPLTHRFILASVRMASHHLAALLPCSVVTPQILSGVPLDSSASQDHRMSAALMQALRKKVLCDSKQFIVTFIPNYFLTFAEEKSPVRFAPELPGVPRGMELMISFTFEDFMG